MLKKEDLYKGMKLKSTRDTFQTYDCIVEIDMLLRKKGRVRVVEKGENSKDYIEVGDYKYFYYSNINGYKPLNSKIKRIS
mgnify:CR=1 FL=1